MLSYQDLKKVLYILQTILGIAMVILSNRLWIAATTNGDPVNEIAALGLFVAGLMCTVFGIMTYLLRQDPDIWR